MQPYELSVGPDECRAELGQIGNELRENPDIEDGQAKDAAVAALSDPMAAQVFEANAPLIARFLTIELDVEHPIAKGIARVHPKEPPPRFGEKFNRSLKQPGMLDRVQPLVDQLVFRGFATAVVANAQWAEPFSLSLDLTPEERWGPFMTHIAATYGAFVDRPDKSIVSAIKVVVCAPAEAAYDEVAKELAGALRPGRRARAATYKNYFPAVGWAGFYASSPEAAGVPVPGATGERADDTA